MKKLFSISLIAAFSVLLSACNNKEETKAKDTVATADVPSVVTSSFTAKYPNATDVEWEHATEDGKKTYKVKFLADGQKMKVEYGADGTFIKVDND